MSDSLKDILEQGLASPTYSPDLVGQIMSHADYSPLTVTKIILEANEYWGHDLDDTLFDRMANHPSMTIEQAIEVADYAMEVGPRHNAGLWWSDMPVICTLMERLSREEQRIVIVNRINSLTGTVEDSWKIASLFSFALPSTNEKARILIEYFVNARDQPNKSQWEALLDAITTLEAK